MSAGKVIAHYKQGPNGRIADYNADYLAAYGPCTIPKHVNLGSGCQDRRDNRDPTAVGLEIISRRQDTEEVERRIWEAAEAAADGGKWTLFVATDEDAKLYRRFFGRAIFKGDTVDGRIEVT